MLKSEALAMKCFASEATLLLRLRFQWLEPAIWPCLASVRWRNGVVHVPKGREEIVMSTAGSILSMHTSEC